MKGIVPEQHTAESPEQQAARQLTRAPLVRYRYQPPYRTQCVPDQEWQRCKLEQLRYKWGNYQGWPRIMQRLGDCGRKILAIGRVR